ncbi:MAG: hypothetical protein K8T89_25755 [Planctomycetes bacterium]|nr:hypothetical protein [Planctomycetota bacterium]
MTPRRWMFGIALGGVLLLNLSGCRHCCKRSGSCPPPPPRNGGPSGPIGSPYPRNLPPQGIPLDPTPSTGMKPEVLLPAAIPPSSSSFTPKSLGGSATLGDPDFGPLSPAVEEKKGELKPVNPSPPSTKLNDAFPLPVGIAGFAQVKDGVSNGMRPDLEGLDWLHSKGYKTVLFLRSGKEDDSSDRKQVTNRGLTYHSLTVKPETINPMLVTEFNRLVNDAEGRSIFVYDSDGKLAGAMWYLYFRTSELLSDDEARVRAGRFGLKDKGGDAEQTRLWTAVQKYLAERNP